MDLVTTFLQEEHESMMIIKCNSVKLSRISPHLVIQKKTKNQKPPPPTTKAYLFPEFF